MKDNVGYKSVVIANGTTSVDVDLVNSRLTAVIFPAAFDGTSLAVHNSPDDGVTYYNITGAGITVTPGEQVPGDLPKLSTSRKIRLVSSATEKADRTLILVLAPIL